MSPWIESAEFRQLEPCRAALQLRVTAVTHSGAQRGATMSGSALVPCSVKHGSTEPLFYTIQPIGFGLRHRQVLVTRERSLFCATKSLTESHGHEETTENLRLCALRALGPNCGSCFICPSLSIVLYGSASLLSFDHLKMLQGKEDRQPSSRKLLPLPSAVTVPSSPGACQPLAGFPYDE